MQQRFSIGEQFTHLCLPSDLHPPVMYRVDPRFLWIALETVFHAHFESAEAIFEDETAYPMGSDRRIKAPIILVHGHAGHHRGQRGREDASRLADLLGDGNYVSLDMLVDQEEEQAENGDESGGDIIDALR